MATKTERSERWPVPIHVRLAPETAESIRELAGERETSVGTIARQAISQYVAQEKKA